MNGTKTMSVFTVSCLLRTRFGLDTKRLIQRTFPQSEWIKPDWYYEGKQGIIPTKLVISGLRGRDVSWLVQTLLGSHLGCSPTTSIVPTLPSKSSKETLPSITLTLHESPDHEPRLFCTQFNTAHKQIGRASCR